MHRCGGHQSVGGCKISMVEDNGQVNPSFIGGLRMPISSDQTQKIIDIARKYDVLRISLFGSFARGEADHSSDLDVLVEFEPGRSLFDLVRLERQLKGELGLDVDVVTPNSLHPLIRERVMAEKVSIYDSCT